MLNTKPMLKSVLYKMAMILLLLIIINITPAKASIISYKKEANGVVFKLDKGLMKVTVCKEDIIEVGNNELFAINKAPNTFRIFVLGESTTIGYPYFHNGSFHRWLQYRLEQMYPDKNFEIINRGKFLYCA